MLEQSVEFHERGKNHKQNVTDKIEEVSLSPLLRLRSPKWALIKQ